MSFRYENLKKVENKINELCLSKRLKIEAEHLKRIKCYKTLRLFINMNVDSSGLYFRINSRVINDFKNLEKMVLSDLVDKFYVVFKNKKINEEGSAILESNTNKGEGDDIKEWVNQGDKVDSFELRYHKNCTDIKLILVINNDRDIMKLSQPFSTLFSVLTCTKPNLIGRLYKYIVKNSLFEKDSLVKCNKELKDIFGLDSFYFTDLPDLIDNHLLPLDNIEIDIPCKINQSSYCFDIPIELDDLFQHPKVHYKDVYLLERKIDTINEIKKNLISRKKILQDFCDNPIGFINKWICIDLEEFSNKTSVFRNDKVQEIMYELLKDVI